MINKKIKQILAQVLIVSIMLPNLNVQAISNEFSKEVIQELNENQVLNKVDENLTENEENALQENEEEIYEENEEEILEDNSNELIDENNQEELNEDASEENIIEAQSDEVINESNNTEDESIKGQTYKKIKASDLKVATFSLDSEENSLLQEREEFVLKQEAIENLEFLVPMTDEEYELTIANSDGSYEFVEAYSDINSAIEAADSIPDAELKDDQQPAVINAEGRVVYSTYQMGRILRYVNGQYTPGNVNIYSDSNLKSAFTYVNQSYMDDAPILDMADKSVQVMISGCIGWVNSNKTSGTYDIQVVPLNQAKNPSYYTVTNGELVHFISYDLVGKTGFSRVLGKAPSILKEGVRYLSYDGQYFYKYDHNSQDSISKTLNTLIGDYRNNTRKNSINNGNPYYLYYLNLPFRSKTIYTAQQLDNFISNHPNIKGTNSKLIGLGAAFKEAETLYGVNAMLALSIAINESNFGKSSIAQTKNNLFGLAAYDASPGESALTFATPKDSVIDFAKNYISRGYSDPADWRYYGGFLGNKNRGANVKYASDPFWGEKAANYAYDIDKYLSGGNTSLKDTNSKQIGIATTDTSVIKKNGTLLYNIGNDITKYQAYINTPFIVSDVQKVTINGKQYYEIYPERNTPVNSGGESNKYHGNYNWNDRGYIPVSSVSLINTFIPQVETKYGQTRYETAVELSKSEYSSANTVIITNGEAIADGLTATPLASYYNAPILLVKTSYVPDSTKAEIKRLGAKNVIIVGGTGVVSSAVEKELKNIGVTKITRLGGQRRTDTALQVAKYIDQNAYDVENVIIANGYGLPDALSIAPVSGRDKMPIILVDTNDIKTDVYNWLKSESINTAYIVGGIGVVSSNILFKINDITKQDITKNRLGGATRYETNAKIVEKFFGESIEKAYVTESVILADALTAGPIAAKNNSPIIITGYDLSTEQKSVLKNKTANKVVKVGGTVSQTAVNNLRDLLSRTK